MMRSKNNSKINPKLLGVLVVLCILAMGGFYSQFSKELNGLKNQPNSPLPAETLDSSSTMSENATNLDTTNSKKDPFKAFLESKAQNPQAPSSPTPDPTFVPGTDPFKAKLDEQKNAPHSAVSPFKN